MDQIITFALSNFTLTFLVIGLLTASIHKALYKVYHRHTPCMALLFSHYLFFSIGCSFLYNFVMHVFFGKMAAAFIGWADSPFQVEVGVASLGIAITGFIAAFYRNLPFRCATLIPMIVFLWGAAIGHIYQMITQDNFAPGNAGIIFWTDVGLPILAIVFLYNAYKRHEYRLNRVFPVIKAL